MQLIRLLLQNSYLIRSRVTMWQIHTCNCVAEMFTFMWRTQKSGKTGRGAGSMYPKDPRDGKELRSIVRSNIIKEPRNLLEFRKGNSYSRISVLGSKDNWIRAEFTIILDPENKGVNNREMVLLLIFLFYWERRKLEGN